MLITALITMAAKIERTQRGNPLQNTCFCTSHSHRHHSRMPYDVMMFDYLEQRAQFLWTEYQPLRYMNVSTAQHLGLVNCERVWNQVRQSSYKIICPKASHNIGKQSIEVATLSLPQFFIFRSHSIELLDIVTQYDWFFPWYSSTCATCSMLKKGNCDKK